MTRIAKFKSAYNSRIIGPGGLQCETNLQEKIMGCESFDVVRFDRGTLLALSCLKVLLVLEVRSVNQPIGNHGQRIF